MPVERRGAVADDETFHGWGLWTGTIWSEESEGTNAIGTSLVEQRPLTIHRGQHFLSRNTALSCTTAPIYDYQGNVAAALDVSSCRADLTEGLVNLIALAVGDAARRIEADDLVIGATRQARLTYGITRERLGRRLPVADIVGGNMRAAEGLNEAERSALHRALARADGNVSAAALKLDISRATLHRKLNRLGIRRAHWRCCLELSQFCDSWFQRSALPRLTRPGYSPTLIPTRCIPQRCFSGGSR